MRTQIDFNPASERELSERNAVRDALSVFVVDQTYGVGLGPEDAEHVLLVSWGEPYGDLDIDDALDLVATRLWRGGWRPGASPEDGQRLHSALEILEAFIVEVLAGAEGEAIFCSPEAWAAQGETSAVGAMLIVTGPFLGACDQELLDQLCEKLAAIPCRLEPLSDTATAIFVMDAREVSDQDGREDLDVTTF